MYKIGDYVKILQVLRNDSDFSFEKLSLNGQRLKISKVIYDKVIDEWLYGVFCNRLKTTVWFREKYLSQNNVSIGENMSKFKVGDEVRVIRKVETEAGWANSWVDAMNDYIGNIYPIDRITSSGIFLTGVSKGEELSPYYGFPASSLELVSNNNYIQTQFKVGDEVRVVRKVETEAGWLNGWISDMNSHIGKKYRIDKIDKTGVYFSTSSYGFPPSSLELVSVENLRIANSIANYNNRNIKQLTEFKVGDKVRVVRVVEHEPNWVNSWTDSMHNAISSNRIFTIDRINYTGIWFKQDWNSCKWGTTDGFSCGFPQGSLELVEQEPVTNYQYLKYNDYFNGLCITISTSIKRLQDGKAEVTWAVAFKNPKDKFDKSLARKAVDSRETKEVLLVGKNFTRGEIVTKILSHLYYNDIFLSAEYKEFVLFTLAIYATRRGIS